MAGDALVSSHHDESETFKMETTSAFKRILSRIQGGANILTMDEVEIFKRLDILGESRNRQFEFVEQLTKIREKLSKNIPVDLNTYIDQCDEIEDVFSEGVDEMEEPMIIPQQNVLPRRPPPSGSSLHARQDPEEMIRSVPALPAGAARPNAQSFGTYGRGEICSTDARVRPPLAGGCPFRAHIDILEPEHMKQEHFQVKLAGAAQKVNVNDVLNQFTHDGRQVMQEENLMTQIPLSKATNLEIGNLSLNQNKTDTILLTNLTASMRLDAKRKIMKPGKNKQPRNKMPDNEITDLFPISNRMTFKALKAHDLLSPYNLYFKATISDIEKCFNDFPTIPKVDKQNILAGLTLVRYAIKCVRK